MENKEALKKPVKRDRVCDHCGQPVGQAFYINGLRETNYWSVISSGSSYRYKKCKSCEKYTDFAYDLKMHQLIWKVAITVIAFAAAYFSYIILVIPYLALFLTEKYY